MKLSHFDAVTAAVKKQTANERAVCFRAPGVFVSTSMLLAETFPHPIHAKDDVSLFHTSPRNNWSLNEYVQNGQILKLCCCTQNAQKPNIFRPLPTRHHRGDTYVLKHTPCKSIIQGVRPPDVSSGPLHPVENAQPFGDYGEVVRGQDIRQRQGGPQGVLAQGLKAGLSGN